MVHVFFLPDYAPAWTRCFCALNLLNTFDFLSSKHTDGFGIFEGESRWVFSSPFSLTTFTLTAFAPVLWVYQAGTCCCLCFKCFLSKRTSSLVPFLFQTISTLSFSIHSNWNCFVPAYFCFIYIKYSHFFQKAISNFILIEKVISIEKGSIFFWKFWEQKVVH